MVIVAIKIVHKLILTLDMFPVVLDVELVDAFLARVVLDADSSIVVVFYDGLVNVSAWHLYFR